MQNIFKESLVLEFKVKNSKLTSDIDQCAAESNSDLKKFKSLTNLLSTEFYQDKIYLNLFYM